MAAWTPLEAYRVLLSRYGPQGWWPVTAIGESRPRYHPGKRRSLSYREVLEISVGAVLTQNTAWSNVEKAIVRLHEAKALDGGGEGKLTRMPLGRLEGLIRSSGYFRQKARRLQGFLRHAEKRGGLGQWLSAPLNELREDLLGVSGIGPETADSILLYAGGRSAFVVDAYTMRIGRRLGWFGETNGEERLSYGEVQRFLVRELPKSLAVYQEFHALLVALAKFHCRTSPLCPACPLASRCAHARYS